MLRIALSIGVLSLICIGLGWIVGYWRDDPRIVWLVCVAVGLNVLAILPPVWLRTRLGNGPKTAGLPLLTVGWRVALLVVPIVWGAATKWPDYKSFSLAILGCYFPFLALESALSIRQIRRVSGSQR